MEFEDFAIQKGEEIEAAFQEFMEKLGVTITDTMAGELADNVNDFLSEKGLGICYPYWEGDEETPCFIGASCKVGNCTYLNMECEECKIE